MPVSHAEASALLAAFLWPLARILALVGTAPVLSSRALPARVKIGLAVALTVVTAPLAGAAPPADPWSGPVLAALAGEMAVGAAMGFVMRLVFAAVDLAGEIAGLQMGLGFATFFDPQSAASTPLLAQFLGLFATLVFFAVDGHLLLVSALAESFQRLPPGAAAPGIATAAAVLEWSSVVFRAGLALSLPVLAALLVVNLALGVLNRASPQLSLFSVGFPVTLLAGFVVLAASLPQFVPVLERLLLDAWRVMTSVAVQP